MFARVGIAALLTVILGFAVASAGGAAAQTPEKRVTLSPTSGRVGTVVTAELFNAIPNDNITVIFKSPGDPVLATGTTDATGYAKFTFTIPFVVSGNGIFDIFFTNFKCSCQIAVPFTVTGPAPTPTATPTAIATAPLTATPTRTATVPLTTQTAIPTGTATPTATASPTASPTATPTPRVPVLGTTFNDGPGGGPNIGVLGLGFLSVITVLAWFTATRRGPGAPAMAYARRQDHDGAPEYSTEPDLADLDRSGDALGQG